MSHAAAQEIIHKYEGTEAHPLLLSLFHDCLLQDLRPKTTQAYTERIHYLITHLKSRGLGIYDVNKQTMKEYILSLKGSVSPATVNGRIRVYKRFWSHPIEEETWSQNLMDGIHQQRKPRKLRPVIGPGEVSKLLKACNKKTFFGSRAVTQFC